jgi:ketosteroid isomerase-like protein
MSDSFFERYFAALDGPDRYSAMALVADDLEFVILWAPDGGRRSQQFRGGPDELRGFTAAGDLDGWSHHLLSVARDGDTEVALGETRWDDDGRHIGTFVCVAELDGEGRMCRYLVGRSPAIRFATEVTSDRGSSMDPPVRYQEGTRGAH